MAHEGTPPGSRDWRVAARDWQVSESAGIPLHRQIRMALEGMLSAGIWKPGDRIPGERELADHFGVSVLTANKAVQSLVRDGVLARQRGRGTFVSAPERRAQAPYVVVTWGPTDPESDSYFAGLLRGIRLALSRRGFGHSIAFAIEWGPDVLASVPQDPVGGFLFVAPHEGSWPDIERIHSLGFPCVVVGGSREGTRLPCVDTDNVAATRAAITYLLNLGHRRIATIQGALTQSNHRDRLRACRQTLAEHGLSLPDHWVIDGWPPREPVDEVRRLLTAPDRPTAIFAGGYFAAIGTIRIARDLGLRVPEDLSVIGFDDPPSAAYFDPPLTTVRQPLEEMGRIAMDTLVECSTQRERDPSVCLLPTEFVERQSCAPAPGEGA